jgi:hypothetical protein
VSPPDLASSRALWNRRSLDLESQEILAQILDRGELWAWRELYARARRDAALRRRILEVVRRVPLAYGHFWLAALVSLGDAVDLAQPLPREDVGAV